MPQGSIFRSNDFTLIVDGLTFGSNYMNYVDDMTSLSISNNPYGSNLQSSTDHLVNRCRDKRIN